MKAGATANASAGASAGRMKRAIDIPNNGQAGAYSPAAAGPVDTTRRDPGPLSAGTVVPSGHARVPMRHGRPAAPRPTSERGRRTGVCAYRSGPADRTPSEQDVGARPARPCGRYPSPGQERGNRTRARGRIGPGTREQRLRGRAHGGRIGFNNSRGQSATAEKEGTPSSPWIDPRQPDRWQGDCTLSAAEPAGAWTGGRSGRVEMRGSAWE